MRECKLGKNFQLLQGHKINKWSGLELSSETLEPLVLTSHQKLPTQMPVPDERVLALFKGVSCLILNFIY